MHDLAHGGTRLAALPDAYAHPEEAGDQASLAPVVAAGHWRPGPPWRWKGLGTVLQAQWRRSISSPIGRGAEVVHVGLLVHLQRVGVLGLAVQDPRRALVVGGSTARTPPPRPSRAQLLARRAGPRPATPSACTRTAAGCHRSSTRNSSQGIFMDTISQCCRARDLLSIATSPQNLTRSYDPN